MRLREYPCTFHPGHTCLHGDCRLATLPKPIAARLAANWQAKDYARNWGLMLYDPKEHGRDPKRRKAMAAMLRAMRTGQADYGQASIAGAWAGALMGRAA